MKNFTFRCTPDSSAIKRVAYSPAAQELRVTFRSGDTYAFSAVPAALVTPVLLDASTSAGKWFASQIKGNFEGTCIRKATVRKTGDLSELLAKSIGGAA